MLPAFPRPFHKDTRTEETSLSALRSCIIVLKCVQALPTYINTRSTLFTSSENDIHHLGLRRNHFLSPNVLPLVTYVTLFLFHFFSILHAQRVKVFQRSKKYIRRSCDHFSKQMLLIRKQCYPRKYSQIGCDCETRYAYTSLTKRCLSIHVSFV